MRSQIIRKLIVWAVIITFFTGVSPALCGSRIMPTGSVKVYENNKLVQVLKKESALPKGALLTTEGKCGVLSENLYLAADDGCTFIITDGLNRKNLRVDNGRMYFAVNHKTDKLAFITPVGEISTEQVRINAGIDNDIVKGYLYVSGAEVQFGVLEGGSLVVATASGVQEIRSGRQLTLSMADPIKEEDKNIETVAAEGEKAASGEEEKAGGSEAVASAEEEGEGAAGEKVGGKIPAAYYVGGAAVLGAALLGALAIQGGDDDSPGPSSPSSP
jgi:hypothetical protein